MKECRHTPLPPNTGGQTGFVQPEHEHQRGHRADRAVRCAEVHGKGPAGVRQVAAGPQLGGAAEVKVEAGERGPQAGVILLRAAVRRGVLELFELLRREGEAREVGSAAQNGLQTGGWLVRRLGLHPLPHVQHDGVRRRNVF